MAYRGGPRYDGLTPREQEVLSLIRDGRSGEEIAERLGIPLGAVHYHEANIYAKFGVSSREAAAAWEPRNEPEPPLRPLMQPAPRAPSRRAPEETTSEPETSPRAMVSGGPAERPPSVRAGLAVLAAALVVIALIVGGGAVLGIDLGGADAPDQGAVAAGTATQTPRPVRTLAPGEPTPYNYFAEDPYFCCQQQTPGPTPAFDALGFGDMVELPPDLAVIVRNSCGGCDGISGSFARVYRRPDGILSQEVLFDPGTLGIQRQDSQGGSGDPYIVTYALSSDGADIAIALCVRLTCGGLGFAEPGAEVTLYRSRDGGITWQQFPFPINTYIGGVTADGELLVSGFDETNNQPVHSLWPSGVELSPAVAQMLQAAPMVTSAGEVVWVTNGLVYDVSGFILIDFRSLGFDEAYAHHILRRSETEYVVSWSGNDSGHGTYGNFITMFVDGMPVSTRHANGVSDVHELRDEPGSGISFIGSITPDGSNDRPPSFKGISPGLVNLEEGVATPIANPFLVGEFVLPRPFVVVEAAQSGPFARVTGTGFCLNLRNGAGTSAAVLDCMSDGVLLRVIEPPLTIDIDGTEWLHVVAPHGRIGYVATQYVEY